MGLIATAPRCARAEINIPDTGAFVIDRANVLDAATRERLERLLKELEEKTTNQVKVLTIDSTDGEDIVGFAQRHYESWRLGQKGKDNGVLIVLDIKDHHLRVHTGYGLEGSLPDSWIGTVSREIARQYLRAGKYPEGLYQLTLSVVNKLAADAKETIAGLPQAQVMPPDRVVKIGWFPCCIVLLIMGGVTLMTWRSQRRMRQTHRWDRTAKSIYWGTMLSEILRSGSGPWGGGGGFGSGGFGGGGFGDGFGGGGSFGGGGHSGGGGGGASW